MNNNNLNQELNVLCNTEIFESIINEKIKTDLLYYDWLQKYLNSKDQSSFKRDIEYINNCRMIDTMKQVPIVYFIRNQYTGLLKIGKTNDLKRRINEIRNTYKFLGMNTQELILEAISYCPYGISNAIVESYYHNLFKSHRKTGEWFDITYEQLQNIFITDYIINGVMVCVEDPDDYNNTSMCKLIESDINQLKQFERNTFIKSYKRKYGIYDIPFEIIGKYDYIRSIDLYKYIMSQSDDINLNNKIKAVIENVLNSCI